VEKGGKRWEKVEKVGKKAKQSSKNKKKRVSSINPLSSRIRSCMYVYMHDIYECMCVRKGKKIAKKEGESGKGDEASARNLGG